MKSWKPEVFVQGKWSRNALVFATEAEAFSAACALMDRWILVDDARAVEVDEPVRHAWVNGEVKHVEQAP